MIPKNLYKKVMFNVNPQFESIEFTNPVKCSDGRYFIGSNLAHENEASQEIYCQFGPNLLCKTELGEGVTNMEMHIANEAVNEFISECDDHFLAKAKDMKETWFPTSEISDSYLENALMPSTKLLKKQSTINSFKATTSKNIEIYNSSKEPIERTEVKENSKV